MLVEIDKDTLEMFTQIVRVQSCIHVYDSQRSSLNSTVITPSSALVIFE